MNLEEFNKSFVYESDSKLDSWHILNSNNPKGDCDDYAITVAYIEAGNLLSLVWGLLTFKYVPWYVWSENNVSHIALWVRNKGWIDNWYPSYSKTTKHKKRFPAVLPIVLVKLLIGKIFK